MQKNSSFGWKSFISFFGSWPQARTCEKFWKKYILKIHKFYVQFQQQTLKMQKNSIRIDFGWKSSFHFLALGRRRGPVKKSEKNIFWKSTNFMFNCKSRPWKCKRTAFELILVEKVSFHFLALGRRRGPVKKSEKNIFWKSTNFMFNSNSRPWKCKRTFESMEKNTSFFGSIRRRGHGWKNSLENPFFGSRTAGADLFEKFHFIFWP